MKKYINPTMDIRTFSLEDILNQSPTEIVPPFQDENDTPWDEWE